MENFQRIFRSHIIIEMVNSSNAAMDAALEFQSILNEDILLNKNDVIVDLSKCKQIDSAFLGVLVLTMKKLKLKNRNLILVEPSDENLKNDLILRGSYIAFDFYESRNAAINSLNPDSEKKLISDQQEFSQSNLALGLAG